MKKLILFILLLCTPIFAGVAIDTSGSTITRPESQSFDKGTGILWTDSLWNGVYVLPVDSQFYATDTIVVLDTLTAHTSVMIPLDFEYDFGNITCIDTSTTIDTVRLEYAVFDYGLKSGTTRRFEATDTTWQLLPYVRDSSWANTGLTPDGESIHSYSFWVGDQSLIRVYMANAVIVNNGVFKFKLQISKKK